MEAEAKVSSSLTTIVGGTFSKPITPQDIKAFVFWCVVIVAGIAFLGLVVRALLGRRFWELLRRKRTPSQHSPAPEVENDSPQDM